MVQIQIRIQNYFKGQIPIQRDRPARLDQLESVTIGKPVLSEYQYVSYYGY